MICIYNYEFFTIANAKRWHCLSAFAVVLSYEVVFLLDIDIRETPRTDIRVF
jgi:hypothetical protein